MISPGEGKAWEILRGLDPSIICRSASVSFDGKGGYYILKSFCTDFFVNPREKIIRSSTLSGEIIIKRYDYFFIHSCLWYLINAKDISLTGKLIKPSNLKGGDLFFRGSHILPLGSVARRYGNDKEAFIKRGKELCAEAVNYGDVSIKLLPMPRIPVTVILWLKDEEFPPRADLLLDSTCELQLPLDIIWSIAMMSVLVMI
ncbi:MAG: hypothetical protein A2Z47_11495 [Thermodesulfovibrio sp. RBG_19FT_COMBO_42_12]|nr:MAG: hypothetical protein A2Z47_11495 [Thermodesulfovibrio sp. RBG_19FT_COMBO_42_12]